MLQNLRHITCFFLTSRSDELEINSRLIHLNESVCWCAKGKFQVTDWGSNPATDPQTLPVT